MYVSLLAYIVVVIRFRSAEHNVDLSLSVALASNNTYTTSDVCVCVRAFTSVCRLLVILFLPYINQIRQERSITKF